MPGSKLLLLVWYGSFIVKAEDQARYTMRTVDRRRFLTPSLCSQIEIICGAPIRSRHCYVLLVPRVRVT